MLSLMINLLVRKAAKLAVYIARTTMTTSHQKRSTIRPEMLVGQLMTGSWLRRDANTIQDEFAMFSWAEKGFGSSLEVM